MKLRQSREPPTVVIWGTVSSLAGKLAVGLTEKSEICRVSFLRGAQAAKTIAAWKTEWPETIFIQRQKKIPDIKNLCRKPILLVGTVFQCAVWRAIAKIPVGRRATYGEIARRIGKAGAVRAVGTACGANPVPYFIPCHRVVGATGLGGFSAGLEIKKVLLKSEGR